jgi:hypothetical protein
LIYANRWATTQDVISSIVSEGLDCGRRDFSIGPAPLPVGA